MVFISLEVSSSLSRAPAAGPDAEDRQAKYTSPKRASGRLGAAGAKRGDEVRAAVKRERPPVLKVILTWTMFPVVSPGQAVISGLRAASGSRGGVSFLGYDSRGPSVVSPGQGCAPARCGLELKDQVLA